MHGHTIEAEHLARYAWAAQFATGRRILDAACGTAYGTAMLAAAGASEVVGVDIDERIIETARSTAAPSTSFEVTDLRKLPYGDAEFDLVVCFEAIEHVADPGLVLDQLARVLRSDGLLLVSTPNRNVYTPGNPFHLRELTPNELEEELSKRFRSVALRRQHTWVSSGIFDDEAFEVGDNEVIDGVEVRKACANEAGKETYTLGLASDGELPVGRGLLGLTSDVDIRDWSAKLATAGLAVPTASNGDGTRGAEIELLRNELDELRRQLVRGEADLAQVPEMEEQLASAREALAKYEDLVVQHEAVIGSRTWRLARPLRRLAARLRGRPR